MFYRNEEIEQRFWEKVDKSGDCWEWKAGKDRDGYGGFTIYHGHKRQAHRVAYFLLFGEIPEGLNVLHKCDNPPCVNPDHLWLGTTDDNNKDRARKKRSARLQGEKHALCKFTTQQIREVKRLLKTQMRRKDISKLTGVSLRTVRHVKSNTSWTHI